MLAHVLQPPRIVLTCQPPPRFVVRRPRSDLPDLTYESTAKSCFSISAQTSSVVIDAGIAKGIDPPQRLSCEGLLQPIS